MKYESLFFPNKLGPTIEPYKLLSTVELLTTDPSYALLNYTLLADLTRLTAACGWSLQLFARNLADLNIIEAAEVSTGLLCSLVWVPTPELAAGRGMRYHVVPAATPRSMCVLADMVFSPSLLKVAYPTLRYGGDTYTGTADVMLRTMLRMHNLGIPFHWTMLTN